MDFRLTPEQTGFAQSLAELMTKADSVSVARSWAAGDSEPGLALWRRLSEQGINALLVSEEDGGMGGTAVDLVVAFEVLGHQLAVGPWIESAAYLTGALEGAELAAVAEGALATLALPPHVPLALDADVAQAVYVPGDAGLQRLEDLPSPDAVLHSVDTTRRLFDITGAQGGRAASEPLGGRAASAASDQSRPPAASDALGGRAASEALRRAASVSERTVETSGQSRPPAAINQPAFDRAALAAAAELLGCGERLLADSVDYVKVRKQYGRTIGSYQAIKHSLADVRIALDFARPLVHGAALSVAEGSPTAGRDVSGAKVAAGDAAYLASRVALQVHGAIGYTAEFDLGLWINRVRALVGAWGSPSHHRSRIAESLVPADAAGA